MENKTQVVWIKKQLRRNGFITRNQCLKRFISRLGARIRDLKNEGWIFSSGYMKTRTGRDYVYTLLKEPK